MTECKRLWTEACPPYPAGDIRSVRFAADGRLFEPCACFWLFRYLHGYETPEAALLGDYCFGRFSHHLAKLDNVQLTDAFGEFLREDTVNGLNFPEYLDFISRLGAYL